MPATLRRLAMIAVLATLPATLDAQGGPAGPDGVARFGVDRGHSAAEFVVRFMGLSKVRGRFSDFSGGIVYDADVPERSTVAITIDVASIDTDNDMRDDHLRSPDWLDAERWPTITFASTSIERTGADAFLVTGPLTIKETTRVVSIPMTRLHDVRTDAWGNWRIGFEGALTIDRKEFGVEGHNFFNRAFDAARVGVADEVRIELTISGRVFNMSKIAYRRGEPPSIGGVIEEAYDSGGIETAVRRYEELKEDAPDAYDFGAAGLNTLGYKLLQRGRLDDAIEILRLNLAEHPTSGGAMDSLAEAYLLAGDRERAIDFTRRSLEQDPEEPATIAMLRWLEDPPASPAK